MLNFLIESYISWAKLWGVQLPLSVFGHNGLLGREGVELHIWQWLTGSTLFLDFAQEICGTWPRYWWTSQALWATMGVNIFMGYHGTWCPVSFFEPAGLIQGYLTSFTFLPDLQAACASSLRPAASFSHPRHPSKLHHNKRSCNFLSLPFTHSLLPCKSPAPPPFPFCSTD